jgi:site-specific DNA-methyltransferase (adenine-specific)/modification methylase
VVSDPPYAAVPAGYDATKTRRNPSHWERNFTGYDQDFDPTPWLRFPEVILFGADHYRDSLPRGGSWICWDKLAGTTPADFAPGEWAWTNLDTPPQFYPHLWRGGMRAGEENISRLRQKHNPNQKPVSVMQRCVRLITPGRIIIDPFMGSGSTLVACVREGYPCIGIEMEERDFEIACRRIADELQQPALSAPPSARTLQQCRDAVR